MNAEELAEAVDELDTRLERLRVLMEQYFQGIEKIPPNVVHKDVDRRIWILRREKIRNTGTRFRFQQIIQRYNTFSSYWMRIMREIENGTYKRDVLRAKKRFGIDANKPNAQPPPQSEPPPPSFELEADEELNDDLSDFGDLGPLPTGPTPPVAPKPPPNRPPGPPPPANNHTRAAPPRVPSLEPASPPQPVAAQPPPPKPAIAARPLPQRAPPSPALPQILASKVENDDDLDNMLDAALGPAAQGPKKPEPVRPAPVIVKPATAPAPKPAMPALKPQPTQDQEYRRVYAQYVEARRRNGESTAGITYETLAKSLEQTKDKLRDKTAGKKIDFEVAVKDGKTILKPVVR